ncbi:cytidylyltransferase domain-containing protein, partial [Verrucomicrobiota bacterium]
GSKSIKDKNVYTVGDRPLVRYPIQAALDARLIQGVYVSTDGENIARVAEGMGCRIIRRPPDLAGDHVNHGDVIKHATECVDGIEEDLESVVLLLGNTVMIDGELIDHCLRILADREDLDSVMTVWEAADDHPLRSLEIADGLVRSYGDPNRDVSTERQSYPKAYYYDQGVWAFRKECVQRRDGPNPWWWMGKRCFPVVRPWVTGRDIHTELDVAVAEWWLSRRADRKKHISC